MTQNEISKTLHELGARIGLNSNSNVYPTISQGDNVSSDGLTLYFNDGAYHYVAMERGEETKHYTAKDLSTILYYVFKDITFRLAQDYELKYRVDGEDFRKIVFDKQLELLGEINREYRLLRETEIKEVLRKAPYKS